MTSELVHVSSAFSTPMIPLRTLDFAGTELVFGLVAPVGTNLSSVEASLIDHAKKFGYGVNRIKLSSFLDRLSPATLGVTLKATPEYARISSHMVAGNKLRKRSKRGDLLALYAVSEISKMRRDGRQPIPRTIHLLHSLKNPEEVDALRRIYGPGFFLIGVYSPEASRIKYLTANKDLSEAEAKDLVERDRSEASSLGQQTRDTFQLADVFVRQNDEGSDGLWRFIDLVFGHPFHTPTLDENAMFLAYAASLRSGDLTRQIGAVIVSSENEIVSTGTNDVPRFWGGLYWPGSGDQRDVVKGFDSNKKQIGEIAEDTLRRVLGSHYNARVLRRLHDKLRSGRLYDLTEFGRAVHAEMEALMACARIGVSPRGGTLYTTTFPCHNCAKHIVDAGINRVVYVEPYPKSRALDLHSDALVLEEREDGDKRVLLDPFIGIAARRYFDLFSTRLGTGGPKKRSREGKKVNWDPSQAKPRIGMAPASYLGREKLATSELLQATRKPNGRKKTH